MYLAGDDYKQIQAAFLDAFDTESFRQMLRQELNVDLERLALGAKSLDVVFERTLGWAQQNDCVDRLVAGAKTHRPHNQRIQNLPDAFPDAGAPDIGSLPPMRAVDRASAMGRYLAHVIAHNRYLQLQGIRSGGRLVHIELDHSYITLRATRQRTVQAEEQWLTAEADLAPGERRLHPEVTRGPVTETVTVSVNEALAEHRRLVVLGDPGSGKTTLLRYLALVYARDRADNDHGAPDRLGLPESGTLPILLPLRQIGAYLQQHFPHDDGTLGHKVLLDFLYQALRNERLALPEDFFDADLQRGQVAVLCDGLDEISDPILRGRTARLVEAFVRAYPACRYVITSRIVGYRGAARLGEEFGATTVRDFTLADVERFLGHWQRVVAISDMGAGPAADLQAERQTQQLLDAIRNNERIRQLAINPLLLTVIALVHRDRVKLPDRRAELYAEAVDVLLGKWDEARGVPELAILGEQPFDAGDKRLVLQGLALRIHAARQKEIDAEELAAFLKAHFSSLAADARAVERAVERFLWVITERAGLLTARGQGVFAFSHLTFQEYLAALAVAPRDDYVAYTTQRAADSWWREVILLEAGHLSTLSRERTTRLIAALADLRSEPEPYHNLVLAAECLRDVGRNRLPVELAARVGQRLRRAVEAPLPWRMRWLRETGSTDWVERRSAAVNALVQVGAGYWTLPYGEPEWVSIPAGEFIMGEGAKQQRVQVAAFDIARTPVTNAQYALFVQATGQPAPEHWEEGRPPRGLESHPVVEVTWYDAIAYCRWLSQVTGQTITLPHETEWEKAARGDRDARTYPWGDTFDRLRCNTRELGVGGTTPVGIFPNGASPYGVLDMSGNVWEWCRNKDDDPADDKVDDSGATRALRGGSWDNDLDLARAAYRNGYFPSFRSPRHGFRVRRRPPSQ